MATRRLLLIAGGLTLGVLAIVYRGVVVDLMYVWWTDDKYSHGFLIPPIAAYLTWQRRDRLAVAPRRWNALGLLAVVLSVLLLALRIPPAELFMSGISLVGAVAGAVLFFCGWAWLRILAFPLAVLLLMVPLPVPVINAIELPLQMATSQLAATLIGAVGVPVLREGNLLTLANIVLEVAEECSGFRTLISLLTLGLVFGYVPDSRSWPRVLIALVTIPVVVIANGSRVAITGLAAHYYGPRAAQGFFHDLCGWLAFAAAFASLLLLHRLLLWIAPDPNAPPTPSSVPASI